MKHRYDFDSATVAGFLLKASPRLHIEANPAALLGHTVEHDLKKGTEELLV